ncbi:MULTISPECIES: thioredoxin-dependent thiol peroxidase [unclassified Paenibacillus]|uniref:thioredoxin-dependent thiol peroxidase n=1 Tax=unclassified Paenibacillus TaxID=185978 RepID=UPI001C12080C|nr:MULTISPECIES: thioredoxin-dependent thiol peroxidase [unclassified Paenibacillus]MBU5443276.1 thioredoxin-dependent thiol peroxidase [Paenibacillus sp. MSJ-34]CAH0118837.1 Putative peroxiredoxin bcp [Paenibacillus sp. CECT 9249]
MSQVQIGERIPDFKLPASNGEEVALSDYRGKKVVLYFYPQDMTPTCTQESCDFRDFNGEFARHDAVVLGISPDDIEKHRKFIGKYELPFLLLSDTDHRVCELFGVWQRKKMFGREYMGVVRSTFLIDEEGKLAQEWRNIRVKGHIERVLEAVGELGED